MESSKHFDEQIKRAMEGLEPEMESGAWELFEQKLGDAEMAEADELFRQRFGNFEVTAQPGSWEAMEQLIEADEMAEMDNLVQEKLSGLEVPFQNKHWGLMAHRLEEEFTLRKQIYRFKTIEVALMALLLLTFIRFLPFAEEFNQPTAEVYQTEIQTDDDKGQFNSVEQTEHALKNSSRDEAQNEKVEQPIASTPSKKTDINFTESKTESSELLKDAKSQIAELGQPSFAPVSAINILPISVHKFLERGPRQAETLSSKNEGILDQLAVLETKKLSSNFEGEDLPTRKIDVLKKKDKRLRFSIFTTTDVNYVTTPADKLSVFDTTVATSAHKTLAAGYGGGVLMSWKRGKTEFQTGGIYSFKRYMPNTPVFLFKTLNYYIKEDFKGVQLDILQVPFNVNRHFKDRGNWRFYGSAGLAGNFVTASVYEIEQEQTQLFDPLNPPSGPDDFRTIRKEKEFPAGLLDGGELNDNFYFTFNAGVGVERYISPKWVIFFQPNYQHYIISKGVGANNDKIHSTSFYLGTKFNLK